MHDSIDAKTKAPVFVKGLGSLLGRVIVLGDHGSQRAEPSIAERRESGLAAPGDHHVCFSVAQVLQSSANRVCSGGAGGRNAVVWTL